MKITKLKSAKCQLETAIRLYFNGDDPISVHTLACAAYEVITELRKRNVKKLSKLSYKEEPTVKNWLDTTGNFPPIFVKHSPWFKEEYRKDFHDSFFANARNFFKHAKRDPDKILEFDSSLSEYIMFDACVHYRQLTKKRNFLFIIYERHFSYKYPQCFLN